MKPSPNFATAEQPIRASSLPSLVKCSLRVSLMSLEQYDETSGEAADTGSLVHAAVDHWHKNKDDTAALEEIRKRIIDFPQGNIGEAETYTLCYINDPRNQDAKVIASEMRVTFTIQQEPDDEYGPIYVRGTLDQIREEHGLLYLWDLKTGKKYSGWEMLHIYAAQQAAYVLGACQALGKPVYPGGIIRAYGYRVRGADSVEPPGVFIHSPWDIGHCSIMLRSVARVVREVRYGKSIPTPGDHCNWCPVKGLGKCLPAFENFRGSGG